MFLQFYAGASFSQRLHIFEETRTSFSLLRVAKKRKRSPFLFHARRRPVVETQIKLSTGVKRRGRGEENAFSAFSNVLIVATATSGRRIITHSSDAKPVLFANSKGHV